MIKPFIIEKKNGKDRYHFITVLRYDDKKARYLCAQDTNFLWVSEADLVEKFKYIATVKGQ